MVSVEQVSEVATVTKINFNASHKSKVSITLVIGASLSEPHISELAV